MTKYMHIPIVASSILFVAFSHAQTIQSTFNSGTEDWRLVALPNSPETEGYTNVVEGPVLAYSPDRGNPGGTVYWGTVADFHFVYFAAPSLYLGQRLANEGGSISYEQSHTKFGSAPSSRVAGVVLVGGGRALVTDTGVDNVGSLDWTTRTALLTAASGWHFDNLSGVQPTPEQFRSVLSNLTALYIRAEYFLGDDDCYLDNVVLRTAPTNSPDVSLSADLATQISWSSQTNKLYLVQWASAVETNSWFNLRGPIPGNGRTNYVCDVLGNRARRFYRVVTLE